MCAKTPVIMAAICVCAPLYRVMGGEGGAARGSLSSPSVLRSGQIQNLWVSEWVQWSHWGLGPRCQLWEHSLRPDTDTETRIRRAPGTLQRDRQGRSHEISVLLNTKIQRYIIDFLGGVVPPWTKVSFLLQLCIKSHVYQYNRKGSTIFVWL